VISKGGVESVVVVNSMAKETTLPSYRIILLNQSNKNIVGLVFDDGTYEGDAETAAAVRRYRAGEKIVLPRLILLFDASRIDSVLDS